MKGIYLITLFLVLGSSGIFADMAIVDITLDLDNIATIKEDSPQSNLGAIIPYDEIIKVDNYIDDQTKLGRTVKIHFHLVNYEPNEDRYSDIVGGFHIFDFTWFRLRTFVEYKDRNGEWTSMISVPTGFNFNPHSVATIHSYGDTTILISPTICPGGFCLGGGGEQQGKFPEELVSKIEKENYRISIIKYPVIKSVYLLLNDSNLLGKKLELTGDFILGDSVIETKTKPQFFPFDKYSSNFVYSSYYDSKVTIYLEDIEDLKLSSLERSTFSIGKGENKDINLMLARGEPVNSILWNIFMILVPFILYILEKEWKVSYKIRIFSYLLAFISLYFLIPVPINVSKFNLLNIVTWSLYIVIIIWLEIVIYRQKKNKDKINIFYNLN